jgi:chromosome segregation protein
VARRERAEAEGARQRERLGEVRERLEQALELHRQKDAALREARALEIQLGREAQEAGFSERECLSKLDDNQRAAATANSQLQRIEGETGAARTELAGISDTVLQEQLHAALDGKRDKESALAERRNVLETAAAEVRSLDEQRLKLEQGMLPCATGSTTCGSRRRRRRSTRSSSASAWPRSTSPARPTKRPSSTNSTPAAPSGSRTASCRAKSPSSRAEIEALGPVNLAALEELATASERKGFLDAQSPTSPRPSARWKTPSAASTAKRASSCRRPTTRSTSISAPCSRNSSAAARRA